MITPAPLAEMREHLGEFADHCRSARWFGALFFVRVAADILADLAAYLHAVCRKAYAAEQLDREALKLIDAAQSKESAGGSSITQEELAPIKKLIARAADAAHDASDDLAHV